MKAKITNRFVQSKGWYRVELWINGIKITSVEIPSIQRAFDMVPEGCPAEVFVTHANQH